MPRPPRSIGTIVIRAGLAGGQPRVGGTGIPVQAVLEKLADGCAPDDLLVLYPSLASADVRAVLEFAAATIGSRYPPVVVDRRSGSRGGRSTRLWPRQRSRRRPKAR